MIFKLFCIILGIIVAYLFIAPLRETTFNIGNVFGICVSIGLLLIGALYNMLKDNSIFKLSVALYIFVLILYFITLIPVLKSARKTAKKETTVIVLGCRVKWDKPSLSLIQRCKVASDYLKQNGDAVAILSGGQGKDEALPEAEAMLKLMVDNGIEPHRLYIENKSTSTEENLEFSKRIIEDNNLSTDVAIATSEYHECRAIKMAKQIGLNASSLPAGTKNYTKPVYFTREVIGIWYMIIK